MQQDQNTSPINNQNQTHQNFLFQFKGSGSEYFRVWIVNIFLTLITLGIYSAWAKVRTKKYFYNNTFLMDSAFDYTGNPIAILKGRIIAVVFFIGISVLNTIFPLAAILAAVALLFFSPWIIAKSLVFNARNSIYRNIRFKFDGTTSGAAGVFIGWLLLAVISLYTLLPVFLQKQNRFIVEKHGFGQRNFSFHATIGNYYALILKVIGITLALFVSAFGIGQLLGANIFSPPQADSGTEALKGFIIIGVFAGLILLNVYTTTRLMNLFWNNVGYGVHYFTSKLKVPGMLWLVLSNTLLMVLTLGIYYPWAMVRLTRYRLNNLSLFATEDIHQVIAAEAKEQSALAEGAGDIFDINIAF